MLKFIRFSLLICLVSLCSVDAQENWDPKQYSKHSQSQQDDAADILNQVYAQFDKNAALNILEVGCRDGSNASKLSFHFPNAHIIAIDASPSMIEQAKTKFDGKAKLKFQVAHPTTFNLDKQFDLVVSFFTLHWVAEQQQALRNIYGHLKPKGTVYILIAPSKEGLPFANALMEVMNDWKSSFQDFKNSQYFFDLETYRKYLIEAGFHIDEMHYIFHQKTYQNSKVLGGWVRQWLPHVKHLPDEQKDAFMADLMHAYLKHSNTEESASIPWGEYVIIVKATKL